MPTPAIVLFIKAPRPGEAKTRLTPFLTAAAAAEVAGCLARDAVALARRCLPPGGRLVIAYAPDDGWADLEQTLGGEEKVPGSLPLLAIRQRGSNLGERMKNAVYEAAFEHDCGPLILLGADCPLLPPYAVSTAFRLLLSDENSGETSADVVLGPAEDGGYYLLGLRGPDQMMSLMNGVGWGGDQVFAQTVANAQRLLLWVSADLPFCYDIDRPTDILRLREDLKNDAELRERAPTIADWLQRNYLPDLPDLPNLPNLPALNPSSSDGHR